MNGDTGTRAVNQSSTDKSKLVSFFAEPVEKFDVFGSFLIVKFCPWDDVLSSVISVILSQGRKAKKAAFLLFLLKHFCVHRTL